MNGQASQGAMATCDGCAAPAVGRCRLCVIRRATRNASSTHTWCVDRCASAGHVGVPVGHVRRKGDARGPRNEGAQRASPTFAQTRFSSVPLLKDEGTSVRRWPCAGVAKQPD